MLNVLVAYPYMKPDVISLLQQNKSTIRFLLDSGAFTAWKAGKQINLDDYCRFIESLPFEPWGYFMLDVIGNPGATMKNYETMVKRGFKPIPIFTRGEDVSVLEDYYKTSDVVGIGGLVGTPGNKGFVKGIMDKVNGRKCHWLGFTPDNFLKFYKPFSADSSSWNSGGRYGFVSILNEKTMTFSQISKEKIKKTSAANLRLLFKNYVEDISNTSGFDSIFTTPARISWLRFSYLAEKKIGTKVFLATSTCAQAEIPRMISDYQKHCSK